MLCVIFSRNWEDTSPRIRANMMSSLVVYACIIISKNTFQVPSKTPFTPVNVTTIRIIDTGILVEDMDI